MRKVLISILILMSQGMAIAQTPIAECSDKSPKDVVEQLWMFATRGDLLDANGVTKFTRGFFVVGSALPSGDDTILIVSNNWGPAGQKVNAQKADVTVGFENVGAIDSKLRYSPPKSSSAIKTGMLYHLVCQATHYSTFRAQENKLVVDKVVAGPPAWQIEGSPMAPFGTVNAVIRYVLETRNKTQDPEIKKNADETLSHLLSLH